MTELSSPSLVTTLSAESDSVHRPRPPDAPRPSAKPFTARRSKIVPSPYLVTSTPKKAATNHQQKWAHVSSAWGSQTFNSEIFLQTLMKSPINASALSNSATKKRKRSHSTVTHTPGAGDPFEVSREDLLEELQIVKKQLKAVGHERDTLQARLRRSSEEIVQKDKQIEELLAQGVISSSDALRVTSGGKAEAFISSLRHKVHTLQMSLRDKEKEVATLHQDIRSTRLKEAELASEVYYKEVCRLQKLLEHLTAEHWGHSPQSYQEAQIKSKALEEGVARLSQQLEEVEVENKSLKEELKRAQEKPTQWTGHSEKGYRGSIADKYVGLDRAKMLSTIVDLELKAQESSKTIQSLCREFDEKKDFYEGKLAEANGKYTEAIHTVEGLESKRKNAEETQEKLRGTIKKLKEDRTHYRSLAEQLQAQLNTAREQLHNTEASLNSAQLELGSLRKALRDELLAREHAQKLISRRSAAALLTRTHQEMAAAVIQRSWRKRRALIKQNHFQESLKGAVLEVQNALRAHMTRRRALEVAPIPPPSPPSPDTLSSASSDDMSNESESGEGDDGGTGEGDDAEDTDVSVEVEMIQSVLRAYQTRRMAMLNLTADVSLSNEEGSSGNDTCTTTSAYDLTSSSVVSNNPSFCSHMRSYALSGTVNEPHLCNRIDPPPQGLPLSTASLAPLPQERVSHIPEQMQPLMNEPCLPGQTCPPSKPQPDVPVHPAALEPCASIAPQVLRNKKGVEAWRTLDYGGEVHTGELSSVECTSPPLLASPRSTENLHVKHAQSPLQRTTHTSRRCWSRSGDKVGLKSKSMLVFGNVKLDFNRSQSIHQINIESNSSGVEEKQNSPERMLLTDELS